MEEPPVPSLVALLRHTDDLLVRDVMEGLVAVLLRGNDSTRLQAITAMENLADIPEEQMKFGACPGAMPALVATLVSACNSFNAAAARALQFIARHNRETQVMIASIPAAFPSLVALVENGDDECKRASADALGALAWRNAEIQAIIASVPAALPSLALLLQSGAELGKAAADCALGQLSVHNAENQARIACTP